LIRVLPPERYDEIVNLREKRRGNGGAVMPGMSGAGEQR
jgi:hypothetical protein